MYCTVCDKLEVPSYHGNYRLCDICGEHFLCLTLAIQHKEQCRGQNNEIMMVREKAVVTVDGIVKNANDGDTVSQHREHCTGGGNMEGREGGNENGIYINSTEMTTTIIKVNNEILTYSSKKYLARDGEEAKQKLIKHHFAIHL